MYFDLSKPQKLLGQSVREFCKREVPAERVRALMETASAMDDSLWREVADQGWIGLHLDEAVGGLGLGPVELAVVAEELGRACLPGPWLSTNWAATLLAATGGAVAEQYLPGILDGSAQATVAVLEEHASWDACANDLQTSLSADGTKLSGGKQMVLQAEQAELLLCLAQHAGEYCLLSVAARADGVRINATPGIDSTRKLYQCEFDNVPVSSDQILARGEAACAAWQQSQSVATVAVCAEMLGAMEWMLAATVEYAKTRKQFDRVIGAYQSVQHKCADMLLLTESARSAIWYAAWSLQEETENSESSVSVAKVYASEAARQVGDLAVQVHGGIGFTWEHDLHLYYKRVKANEYLFGSPACHREKLAELIL
jgi:alkylation response protein AidB-like acyl-CoA dehydrogenase